MSQSKRVTIPDVGGSTSVEVIDILVSVGDSVRVEQPLLTLEGDKATMDVPSPYEGIVESITLSRGDKVSQGTPIGTIRVTEETFQNSSPPDSSSLSSPPSSPVSAVSPLPPHSSRPVPAVNSELSSQKDVYAGPAVRRLARELGVNLRQIRGTGNKGRLLKEDLFAYVKAALQKPGGGVGLSLLPWPEIDFEKFGPIEKKPLSKIKKLTGANLHRNWMIIPHVTQFAEVDITHLEAYRKAYGKTPEAEGVKLTPLVFIMKAVVETLKHFPSFNASLEGDHLILKHYYHIGVAVDTPNGLVVPVIRQVDSKSVVELAKELAEISLKAREKGLTPQEMSGGCFTISSLGGIGGTAFTPIINAPEVAILGVSRSQLKLVHAGGSEPQLGHSDSEWQARLMLPLSLSYDHRVIDGAEGARFIMRLSDALGRIGKEE